MLLGKYNKKDRIVYEKLDLYHGVPIIVIYPSSNIPLPYEIKYDPNSGEELVNNHWHRSLEIIYTNESTGYLVLNGERHFLEPHSLRLLNSKDIHYLEETEPDKLYTGYAILISYKFLKEFYPDIDNYYFEIKEEHNAHILSLLDMMIQMYQLDREKNKEIICDLLNGLIKYLITYCSRLRVHINKISNEKLLKIVDYIEQNYNQDLDLQRVAEQFDVSYSFIAKSFKSNLGMSAGQFISQIRFEKALIDVATTTETITDIAFKHGFANASLFIKEFKKHKGVSPKQYRKLLEE